MNCPFLWHSHLPGMVIFQNSVFINPVFYLMIFLVTLPFIRRTTGFCRKLYRIVTPKQLFVNRLQPFYVLLIETLPLSMYCMYNNKPFTMSPPEILHTSCHQNFYYLVSVPWWTHITCSTGDLLSKVCPAPAQTAVRSALTADIRRLPI